MVFVAVLEILPQRRLDACEGSSGDGSGAVPAWTMRRPLKVREMAILALILCAARPGTGLVLWRRVWVGRSQPRSRVAAASGGSGGSGNDDNSAPFPVASLLWSSLSRAERTLSGDAAAPPGPPPTEAAADAAAAGWRQDEPRRRSVNRNYNTNPTIATTALAHSLWRHVLEPGVDSAVDATAGNGHDSLALAQMLFPPDGPSTTSSQSMLFAIDIQQQACDNTRDRLEQNLPSDVLRNHVRVLQASHAPLPVRRDQAPSVALVAYNLGFLPGADAEHRHRTTTAAASTVASLADAALLLRVGGMLSVTTYPRTNRVEHVGASALLEGLALLTSATRDWDDAVTAAASEGSLDPGLQDLLRRSLQRVHDEGDVGQTWRVYEHRKMGWTDAPVLLTATRIK